MFLLGCQVKTTLRSAVNVLGWERPEEINSLIFFVVDISLAQLMDLQLLEASIETQKGSASTMQSLGWTK